MKISQGKISKDNGQLESICLSTNNSDNSFVPSSKHYAAIYARISGKGDSFSISSQIDDCKHYIKDKNLFLYETYKDKQSARKFRYYDRKDFKRLLADLVAGMFKHVVLIRRDRLSRRMDDFIQIKRLFNKYGVTVHYVKEGNLHFEEETYVTNFLENILMSISTLEPEYITRRTKGGRQKLRDKGIFPSNSKAPTGYQKVKKSKDDYDEDDKVKHTFKRHPKEAKLIEDIFNYYNEEIILKKNSLNYLINNFNHIQHPNVTKSFLKRIIPRSYYAGKIIKKEDINIENCLYWDYTNSKYILKELDDEGKEIFKKCTNLEPLIPWDMWESVFLDFHLKTNGIYEEDYPFKGIIFCSTCKSTLILEDSNYCCKCLTVRRSDIIKDIITSLVSDLNSDEIRNSFNGLIRNINSEININNNKLKSLRKSQNTNLDLLISTNKDMYKEEIKKVHEEIREIQNVINKLGNENIYYKNIMNDTDIFRVHFKNENNIDIDFFERNYETYNPIVKNFVSKVVYKKHNDNKYSYKIKYKNK